MPDISDISDINESKLKISQLQSFVAVAECGSFSTAALQLGLSQSTVSHAIATLEDELGIVLLARGRHGAVLTADGEEILTDARQILQLLNSIHQKANRAKGFQGGQVRIASVRSIATNVLPEVIMQFRDRFPNITVAITEFDRYAEIEQTLRDGRAEIGFTSLPTTAEFESWELVQDEIVALLPPDSLPLEETLTWEHLVTYPVVVNLRSPQINRAVEAHVAKHGYTLTVGAEVREDSTVVGMVRQGLGAAIMPRLAAEPIPDGIQMRSLPVPMVRVIGVIILADALLPRPVFAFLDAIKQVCQQRQ